MLPGTGEGGTDALDAARFPGLHPDEVAQALAMLADRTQMWTTFLNAMQASSVAEIGVFRGRFAEHLLDTCPAITEYFMIDPWRHLEDWNKPANRPDDTFEQYYNEVLTRTAAHEAKRVVLRGRTVEVIEQIPDGRLDFAYVDGDHTLKGITTDLVRVYSKVRPGGWIGGDDFAASIHQHGAEFEPTFVFPFAVYFADAMAARIYALGKGQFLLHKPVDAHAGEGGFVDLAGKYPDVSVLSQLNRTPRGSRGKGAAASRPAQSSTSAAAGARPVTNPGRRRLPALLLRKVAARVTSRGPAR